VCKLITMVDGPGRIRHSGADPYPAFSMMVERLTHLGAYPLERK
jgi:hypothetical protein